MDTDHDTYVPLLECSHIEGWNGLASYLSSLGIEVTGNSLEIRRRQYGLPIRGGGARGRPVYFTKNEIDAWVQHLRGCSLKAWIARQMRLRSAGLGIAVGPAGRRAVAGMKHLPRFDLYAITIQRPLSGEQLFRDASGYLHAARDPAVFEDVSAMAPLDFVGWKAWRYYGMRCATAADLHGPTPRWRRRSRLHAGRLIGALLRVGTTLRWCHAPGRLLGGRDGVATPFLTSWGLPTFAAAVTWLRSREPDAVFVAWTRRTEVEPFSLEELPRGGLQDLLEELGH